MLTRKTFLTVAAGAVAAMLAGCDDRSDDAADGAGSTVSTGSAAEKFAANAGEAAADASSPIATNGSVLVAYFSATGNTAGIADAIAEHLGADTWLIEAAQSYTADDLDYHDDASRTSQERADARPELARVTPDAWADYDTLLLGYPIWWGEAAWPLRTFAEGNDFSGKTIVPFCTSGSSGIGSSGELLAELAGSGEWREGERFSPGAGEDAAAWAEGLGL